MREELKSLADEVARGEVRTAGIPHGTTDRWRGVSCHSGVGSRLRRVVFALRQLCIYILIRFLPLSCLLARLYHFPYSTVHTHIHR